MLVPKRILVAMLSHTDSESSRYALGAIQLERTADGKPIAIATDGRRLLAMTWNEPEEHPHKPAGEANNLAFSMLLDAAVVKQIAGWKLKPPKYARNADALECVYIPEVAPVRYAEAKNPETGEVETVTHDLCRPVSATDLTANFLVEHQTELEGRFPKWRDVFPPGIMEDADGERTKSITLDPQYLKDLSEAALKSGASIDESRGVTLTVKDHESACVVRGGYGFGQYGTRMACVVMPLARDDGRTGWEREWRPGYVKPERTLEDQLESSRLAVSFLTADHVAAERAYSAIHLLAREAKQKQEPHAGYLEDYAVRAATKADKLAEKLVEAEAETRRLEKEIEAAAKLAERETAAQAKAAEQENEEAVPEGAEPDSSTVSNEPAGAAAA